ncbi:hypothetical protein Q3G72_023387 [Acer saccharum]|nr:hypothetical protein Q3G72_023387 [Acer saccharum]
MDFHNFTDVSAELCTMKSLNIQLLQLGSQDTKSAPINNIQTFPQAGFEDSNDHRRQQSDFVTSAVTQVNQLAAPQSDPQEETAVDQVIVTLTQTETTLGFDRQVDSNIQNFVETTHEETSDGQVESSTQAFPEESSEQATTIQTGEAALSQEGQLLVFAPS